MQSNEQEIEGLHEASREMIVVEQVLEELDTATQANGPFGSAHEGLAVIEEEFIELREEVFTNPSKAYTPGEAGIKVHRERMRAEAIQLAAMAIRFVMDVCGD